MPCTLVRIAVVSAGTISVSLAAQNPLCCIHSQPVKMSDMPSIARGKHTLKRDSFNIFVILNRCTYTTPLPSVSKMSKFSPLKVLQSFTFIKNYIFFKLSPKYSTALLNEIPFTMSPRSFSSSGYSPFSTHAPTIWQRILRK